MNHSVWFAVLLWWCSFPALAGAMTPAPPTVNLEEWQSLSLLPSSQYLLDTHNNLNLDNARAASGWSPLGREQLRFGMEKSPVWLAMEFHTEGLVGKTALLEFNRVIDQVGLRAYQDGVLLGEWRQGAFLGKPAGMTGTNKNVFSLPLQPGKNYQLLVRVQGHNAVTGSVKLWDEAAYRAEDEQTLFFFIAYAVAVLAIALYNVSVYLATGLKAFVYHALYGAGILLMQATQYGYLDSLLQNRGGADSKGVIVLFACCAAYSAVLGLFDAVVAHEREPLFNRGLQLIFLGNLLIVVLAPFIDLHTGLSLFVASVSLGALLGVTHGAYLAHRRDPRVWPQLFMLLVFSPSSGLLILSRLGLIDDTFWAEHWIVATVIAEMLLLSALLFSRIRQMRLMSWQARFQDPRNNLPNILALQEALRQAAAKGRPHALTYCWVAGLEKMEIARGSEFRNQYLGSLAALLERRLQQEGFSLPPWRRKQAAVAVFYCENNTLGILSLPLDTDEHARLQVLLRQAFEQMKLQDGCNMDVTPVIASSNAPPQARDIESVIQNANMALAQCIQTGNTLLLYNDDVGYNERRQITLLNDFETALAQDQFYLQWQPQLDPLQQSLSGLEALVRWRHPVYGELSPVQFIPLLEQNAVITRLSLWVVRQVFTVSPVFFHKFPHLDISINLSVYDLMCEAFLPSLDQMLGNMPAEAVARITMEVTESVYMEDNQRVRLAVEGLQARGFRISIDDFGAGYASFGYLQTLPANELKIDRRYTESCHEANSQAIIRSIIDLANRLHMQIVVEGIEEQHQLELFAGWGVHRLQGWRLGKPALQEEILATY